MKWPQNYLFLVLLLPFWCADTPVDDALAEQHMRAGASAYQRGQYEEAVRQVQRALKVAEEFGEQDPRYAVILSNLGELHSARGRYQEAEPFFRRALVILEKSLGLEHPDVATALNNLAELYRAQGRTEEADRWLRGYRP